MCHNSANCAFLKIYLYDFIIHCDRYIPIFAFENEYCLTVEHILHP